MTRKDYQLIAARVAQNVAAANKPRPGVTHPAAYLAAFAADLAADLERDNPRFNSRKFMAACGLEAE